MMSTREKGQQVKQRIVAAADRLFYQRGYNQTSFSDIADAAGIQRGNFYYYFKSKEDILAAVTESRCASIVTMLEEWQHDIDAPGDRLKRYVRILENEARDVFRFGCPMGSLNSELGKIQPHLQSATTAMMDIFSAWLQEQFQLLGKGESGRELAMELLARTQGIALLSHVYKDEAFLQRQVGQLEHWIDSL